jgi:hypothetical protein
VERLTNKREADQQRKNYEKRLEQGYPRNIPEERFLKLAYYEDLEEKGRLDPCPGYEKCQHFKPYRMTNADHIRSLSDEELAKTFDIDFATCPPNVEEDKWCDKDADCKGCWLEWFKQPYGGAEG